MWAGPSAAHAALGQPTGKEFVRRSGGGAGGAGFRPEPRRLSGRRLRRATEVVAAALAAWCLRIRGSRRIRSFPAQRVQPLDLSPEADVDLELTQALRELAAQARFRGEQRMRPQLALRTEHRDALLCQLVVDLA